MYLVVSKNNDIHNDFCALGHEIHISRYLICDMLRGNYLSEDDIIVTLNDDRKFLYTKLFKHVLSSNEFYSLNIQDDNIIYIYPFMLTYTYSLDEKHLLDFEKKNKYPIRDTLYHKLEKNFNHLLEKIDYPIISDADISQKYVLIHHRTIFKPSNNNDNNNISLTSKLIHFINIHYPDIKVILFTNDINYKFESKVDIYIYSLAEYAALMNNENCQAVISELSGAGEFAQYCHNKSIYLYGNSYNNFEVFKNILLKDLQHHQSLWHKWNLNGITNATFNRLGNLDDVLNCLSL